MIDRLFVLSSLEKVFPDEAPTPYTGKFSMLRGDQLSFQVAFYMDAAVREAFPQNVQVRLESPLGQWAEVTQVKCVPALYPAGNTSDGGFLRTTPGLYPDLLQPIPAEGVRMTPRSWNAVWIQICTDADTPAGEFPVTVTISTDCPHNGGKEEHSVTVPVEVIPVQLPEQKLLFTQWFYCDCIADYYHVEPWSEAHWTLVEKQLRTAAKYGVNMILTPLFTPALDTAVGHERTTVQLVDISRENGVYSFGFEKLERWVRLCRDCGIRCFEMAHLYTQWGAKHCPKIMATADGEYRRIFGWETDAVSPEYREFLAAFLPALIAELKRLGLSRDEVRFHISDEPYSDMLEQYNACKQQVVDLLDGYPVMDALSDYSFYREGVCGHPVVALDHVQPFLDHGMEDLWVYYCVSQTYQVSNRFMCMPSARNRIIGPQLYKYRVSGFLHWGYNFYNSVLSMRHINPFAVTDADGGLPAGDPFSVYPGDGGETWDSIRLRVFSEALHDLRALELLESLTSREHVMELVEGGLSRELTFFSYPAEASYLLDLRSRVNAEIKALSR